MIHTVVPVWSGGDAGEAELLADCYRNSMELVLQNGIHSVAFPSISTGVYAYPVEQAAKIAVETVSKFVEEHLGQFDRVIWVLFDDRTYRIYTEQMQVCQNN